MYTIIGASGKTGSILSKQLLNAGKKVRVIGRDEKTLKGLLDLGAEAAVIRDNSDPKLSKALSGSKVVYVLIPNFLPESDDFRAFQNEQVDHIVNAIKNAVDIENLVVLSSWGAENERGVGPVEGLHYLEQQINANFSGKVKSIVYLRVGNFMENLDPIIKEFVGGNGVVSDPTLPEIHIPFISTRDIGVHAARVMLDIDSYKGINIKEIQGAEDLTMLQVTEILSKHYNRPNASYIVISLEQLESRLLKFNFTPSSIQLMKDVYIALNNGTFKFHEKRSKSNSTDITFKQYLVDFDKLNSN
ncbi:hypothetical protein DLAC_04083 [Tieghemostelium lacteum]|uniref:NmrA-like domain-containing protein n=1 Tax=Tieghemostelium lacteum TaxID=361077 RepID=A0A151ZSM4_TIELA|nr:hypothetical protein DLAC_04083 [Tieghemostelium lacteum]|eukprot:KYQ96784.1 hypothetical protein DLAC_04083 [Tieghemostelium lacteum]